MANRRVMDVRTAAVPALLLLALTSLAVEARMFPMGMSSIMFPRVFGNQGEGSVTGGSGGAHISAFRFSHRSDASSNTTETTLMQHDSQRNSTITEDCLKTVDSPDIVCVKTVNGNMTVRAYEETPLNAGELPGESLQEEGVVEEGSGEEGVVEEVEVDEEGGTHMSFEKKMVDEKGNLMSESVTILLPEKR